MSEHDEHRRTVIEEVTWLTDCGESPEIIARAVSYTHLTLPTIYSV